MFPVFYWCSLKTKGETPGLITALRGWKNRMLPPPLMNFHPLAPHLPYRSWELPFCISMAADEYCSKPLNCCLYNISAWIMCRVLPWGTFYLLLWLHSSILIPRTFFLACIFMSLVLPLKYTVSELWWLDFMKNFLCSIFKRFWPQHAWHYLNTMRMIKWWCSKVLSTLA